MLYGQALEDNLARDLKDECRRLQLPYGGTKAGAPKIPGGRAGPCIGKGKFGGSGGPNSGPKGLSTNNTDPAATAALNRTTISALVPPYGKCNLRHSSFKSLAKLSSKALSYNISRTNCKARIQEFNIHYMTVLPPQ